VALLHARFGVAFTIARRAPTARLRAAASDKLRFIRIIKVLHSVMFCISPAKAGKPILLGKMSTEPKVEFLSQLICKNLILYAVFSFKILIFILFMKSLSVI
jgi:hypothetical protein